MNYQKAWLELKSIVDGMYKNAHSPMTSMAEGVWTESVTSDILKKMENIENGLLIESGFGNLVTAKETPVEPLVNVSMKKIFLVKFKRTPIMQGHYGALVSADGNDRSVERAIVREMGMLSTNVLSANIESIKVIGAKPSNEVRKDVIILNDHEYHSNLVLHKELGGMD